jgi:hypothetical protein
MLIFSLSPDAHDGHGPDAHDDHWILIFYIELFWYLF